MIDTPDSRDPDEYQTSLLATALFCKRANGRIEKPNAEQAAQLLGNIETVNTGMGTFSALVPISQITELGLNEDLWNKGTIRREQVSKYEVPYMLACELMGRLEVVAGKNYTDAKQAVDAGKASAKGGIE